MTDVDKTRDHLIKQMDDMRKRVAELEHEALELNWARDIINARIIIDETCPDSSEDMPSSHAIYSEGGETFAKAFIQNSMPMAITSIREGRFVEVSDAFLECLGLSREEVIGNTFTGVGFITPDQRDAVLDELERNGRLKNMELQVRTKGGEIRYGLFNSSRMQIGQEDHLLTVVTDITMLKQAQESLRMSEDIFRVMTNNLPGAVYEFYVRPQGEMGLYFVSERAFDLLGIECDIEQFFPRVLGAVIPEDRDPLLESIREAARTFSRWEHEARFSRPDGEIVFIRGTSQPRRDGDEIIFDGVLMDVTEQRSAEQALRASEAKYRRLHDAMRDAFVSVDMEGHILECNEAYLEMLGYDEHEIKKLTYQELTPEKWHEHEADILKRQIIPHGFSDVYEKEYTRRDGSVFPVELRTVLVRDERGKPELMWATVRDITERKKSEEALRDSEAKYRFLAERINDIVWTSDMDFRLTYDSPSVEKILGFTLQERMQQSADEMLTPESYAKILEVLGEEFERDKEEGVDPDRDIKLELEYYHKNGSTVWMECIASAIRDNAGKPIGIYGVSRNITDRKKIEEELKSHKDQLEGIVRKRTEELSRAYDQLKGENDARKASEEALKAREVELEKGRRELLEMNSALKVLLKQREEDKASIEMNILSNLKTSVLPYLEKLEDSGLQENQIRLLSMLRSLLGEIVSPFIRNVSSEYLGLTPSEIQVASLIKEGKSSKEISKILNISLNTVHTYRYKIRIKTGLKNNKVNLRSYLQTMA